jgi:hypothetical protein
VQKQQIEEEIIDLTTNPNDKLITKGKNFSLVEYIEIMELRKTLRKYVLI